MNRNRSTTYRCVVFHSQNTKRGSLGWPPLPHPQFKIGPWKKEQIMVPTFVLFHNKPNLFIAFGHHLLCYINYYFNAFETLFCDNYQKWLQLFKTFLMKVFTWLSNAETVPSCYSAQRCVMNRWKPWIVNEHVWFCYTIFTFKADFSVKLFIV